MELAKWALRLIALALVVVAVVLTLSLLANYVPSDSLWRTVAAVVAFIMALYERLQGLHV